MAAKLLHSLTDDNPDLQKQIGCMNGIFQLFDRHHALTGRRISHKRLPPGNPHFNNGSLDMESNNTHHLQNAVASSSKKNMNEKQRVSSESSTASLSSSSCSSSFSSLDCNKLTQPEPSSFDRIIFPEIPSRDPAMSQPSSCSQLGGQSIDLRDVVKDSMYREVQGLSVRTTSKEEATSRVVNHRDSPRPLQLSKSVDGAYGKQNMPDDSKESLRVLAKLQEAPCYFSEAKELARSLYEARDGSLLSIPKDVPRFSYDGREINHLSFESQDALKCTPKLKELPRLSLDSREGSMRGSNSDSKSNFLSRNLQRDGDSYNDKIPDLQQTSATQKRLPSVVAKLMGLEALPSPPLDSDSQIGLIKTCSLEDCDAFSRSSKENDPIRISSSSRNSWKDPTSPKWKNPDSIMKPISSSRFPIEPVPWRQMDGNRGPQKPPFRHLNAPARASNSFHSVYSEIKKRLKDLEFKESGKDLRALKQILEAMQAKLLLETSKEERATKFGPQRDYMSPNQNLRLRNPPNDCAIGSKIRGSNSSRTFESPIVIMKPANPVKKSGIPASAVNPIDDLPGLHKLQDGKLAGSRKGLANNRTAKDYNTKSSQRESAVSPTDKKTNITNLRSTQTSTRSRQLSKENATSSIESSGSVSPRLQQKKLEMEKRSRPPTPSSGLSKSRRQSNRQPTESGSPCRKLRPKSPNLHQSDNQSSEVSSESRNLSNQGDNISLQSDSNIILDSKTDTEVTSTECTSEISGSQSPSRKTSNPRLSENGSLPEVAMIAPEHPSPVSVLDVSVYRDDMPSPVKWMTHAFNDDGTQKINDSCSEEPWNAVDTFLSDNMGTGLHSEMNRKKLQNIENLVQKLRRLNSSHDEASTDYIASLCENTNPEHRYISEILLASGLLLRDLGSTLTTFQLHPSGHPINPELFCVLEQTKANTLLSKEHNLEKVAQPKPYPENFHRKLIFDVVNEILLVKLASVMASPEPWFKPDKLARKTLSAQKLLRELCLEIEQLQAKKSHCNLEDEEDSLKSILREDVMHRSESWTDFCGEIPAVVLDVERSIFKDLVDEVVISEAASWRAKQSVRHCGQLFAK